MATEFKDAKRQNVPLLILLAGGTASGKTESAMRLATGLAHGKPFAVLDTENGRALHKADDYTFKHAELQAPFTAERYAEAIVDADAQGFPVIVIDSGSHVYEGEGGLLDQQADEWAKSGHKESARMSSWIKPKQRHKRFVQTMLRARAHVILCLRAQDKIEIVKVDGKTVVRAKETLIGAEGWEPICEKRLPFEATISLLLTADAPGVPKPIKLEKRHRDLVPLDRVLDEEVGRKLAAWAAGGTLAEPDQERKVTPPEAAARSWPGSRGVANAPDSPETDSSPGSASLPETWDQLRAWARQNGVDNRTLGDTATRTFPTKTRDTVTADDIAVLCAELAGLGVGA